MPPATISHNLGEKPVHSLLHLSGEINYKRIVILWSIEGQFFGKNLMMSPVGTSIMSVVLIGIIVSIIVNEGREWGGINFVNNSAITNLPNDTIVEGHCIVDKRGLTPVVVGNFPKPFILNWQELTVDAALSGDKKPIIPNSPRKPLRSRHESC